MKHKLIPTLLPFFINNSNGFVLILPQFSVIMAKDYPFAALN